MTSIEREQKTAVTNDWGETFDIAVGDVVWLAREKGWDRLARGLSAGFWVGTVDAIEVIFGSEDEETRSVDMHVRREHVERWADYESGGSAGGPKFWVAAEHVRPVDELRGMESWRDHFYGE